METGGRSSWRQNEQNTVLKGTIAVRGQRVSGCGRAAASGPLAGYSLNQ